MLLNIYRTELNQFKRKKKKKRKIILYEKGMIFASIIKRSQT